MDRRELVNLRTRISTALPRGLRLWLRRVREFFRLAQCAVYDLGRYLRYSATVDPQASKANLRASVQKHLHIVEKGLSLPQPRPGFGAEVLRLLLAEVEYYGARYGSDDLLRACFGAVCAYNEFCRAAAVNPPVPPDSWHRLAVRFGIDMEAPLPGGVDRVRLEDVRLKSRGSFEEIASARRSVRNFRPEVVAVEELRAAVRTAQSTPSVCNRQAWRVHCYRGDDECTPVLRVQSGNRGFTECIKNLLVVTCDLSAFMSAGERNQGFVDGGMFAMSLCYALQARGLGSCCLNLALEPGGDREFHRVAGIQDRELLIMVIAVGYLPETLLVARSTRADVDDIFIEHPPCANQCQTSD